MFPTMFLLRCLCLGLMNLKTFLSIFVILTGLIVDLCEGCTARLVFFLDQHFSFQK